MENNKPASKALSARGVESMRPGDKDKADVGENTGLRLSCGSTGVRTFYYRYISPESGSLTQIKIGNYPDVSLAQARVELARLKAMRKSGVCPRAEALRKHHLDQERIAGEQRRAIAASFTVKDLVDKYLTEVIEDRMIIDPKTGAKKRVTGSRKPKGQGEVRRTLYGDAVKVLGDRVAAEVTRQDVLDMARGILGRGANVQTGACLRELSAAYEYAIGTGRLREDFANPALLAKASLKQAKVRLTSVRGKRALPDRELKQVLAWLPGSGFSLTQKNILRLTLWTGCRSGEACQAKWDDIDLEKATWHISASKNEAERYVQLPRQAVEFLRQLKLNTNIYPFPSAKNGTPILQKSLSETKWALKNPDKLKNRREFRPEQLWLTTIPDWSPHDLRRTVRTGLSRLGCRREVAESVLGHAKKGIEGTYDLHTYEAECREWLQQWADHLDTLQ